MKLPTFLIIGVQKAGTTSIYNYLKQHPQVYMSPVKETNFLEKDWESLPPDMLPHKKGIFSFEEYQRLFTGVNEEIAVGEASPNYLFHYQTSANLIKRHVPNAQLIAVLRHPSDRAYSDHLMHIRDNVGTRQRSLSEQIKTRANKSFVIRKGFYHEPLKYFYDEFGSEKIKVFLYDDLCRNPIELMQNIYEFIGVDKTFSPNVAQKAQVAQVPKSQAVNSLLRSQNPVRTTIASTLKLVFPLETRQKIRNHLLQLNYQDKSKAPFSPQDRQALTELYREDILKLQELLQRDLSGWLKK